MTTALVQAESRMEKEHEDEHRQFLTFTLENEVFAVSIVKVREIVEFHSLTSIPMMPEFLCGVTNLRGAVIPVVDLLARFGKGVTEIGKRTCIVIIEVRNGEEKTPLGILVNSVNEVLPVEQASIESRPSFGTSIRADFIEALLNLGGRFVIALDVQQVLSIEEMSGIARAFGGGGGDAHDKVE